MSFDKCVHMIFKNYCSILKQNANMSSYILCYPYMYILAFIEAQSSLIRTQFMFNIRQNFVTPIHACLFEILSTQFGAIMRRH